MYVTNFQIDKPNSILNPLTSIHATWKVYKLNSSDYTRKNLQEKQT